jgi:Undecaprenyl-phosphate galactose phosphotransferase WbaP
MRRFSESPNAWLTTTALNRARVEFKRSLDLAVALILLIALLPLLLMIAAAVARDGGPVFFRHRRIGRDGRSFDCIKFRTMVPNAGPVLAALLAADEASRREWDTYFKLKKDPRITPIGKLLRKSSFDELPQLINVVKGEMSLVGPRPIVREEISRYGAAIQSYYRCRPGITGLWQISGRNNASYDERVRLDVEYARRYSVRRDLKILAKTAVTVLRGQGAY